jgi:hypothetical protein
MSCGPAAFSLVFRTGNAGTVPAGNRLRMRR